MKKTLLLSCAMLAATSLAASADLTTGWYTITPTSLNPVVNTDAGDGFFRSSDNAYYPLIFSADEVDESKKFVKIEVSDGNYYIQTACGFYVTQFVQASRSAATSIIAATDEENSTYTIQYWSTYTPSADAKSRTFVGRSASAYMSCTITAADLTDYDVWTVNINNYHNGSTINLDTYVTLTNDDNKGISSAYNNGTFFLSKNATITEDQISVTTNDDYEGVTFDDEVIIDNENKTITAKRNITAPSLIRIKSGYNAYTSDVWLTNTNYNSRINFITDGDEADETVFVYANGNLCNYVSGAYAMNTNNDPTNGRLKIFDGTDVSTNIGNTINFLATTADLEAYFIDYGTGSDSKTYYLYAGYTTVDDETIYYSDRGSCDSSYDPNTLSAFNTAPYRFIPVDVTTLTVAVDGDMIWRAPAAVSVASNDEVEVYVINVSGNTVKTTKIESGDTETYAAGTGFVFHGTGDVTVTVKNGATGVTDNVANIGGSHARINYTAPENTLALKLNTATEEGESEIVTASTDDETENTPSISLVAVASSELGASEAVIEVSTEVTTPIEENETLTLALGGSSDITTGIKSIQANEAETVSGIYDLQGRRVVNASNGIYIINGKKVLVK